MNQLFKGHPNISANSVKVRGTDCINHVIRNSDSGRAVSVVQHSDGTFNVRNDSDQEIYDGDWGSDLIGRILRALW